MRNSKLLLATAAATAMIGCTKMTPAQQALDAVAAGNIDKSSRPACEIQKTEYQLDAKLVSFEVTDSGGANAGFSLLTGFLKLLSLNFTATSGKLTVGLSLTDPMVPDVQLVNVLGGGRSFDFGASVDAGWQNIGAGFNYTHSTPLAAMALDSLNDGFTNMTTTMTDKQAAWKTEVLAIASPTQFVIPAGTFANIKPGDVFAIWNVKHYWDGAPCASNHLMAAKTTTNPLVYARADQVEANGTLLTAICNETQPCNTTEAVAIGAQVEISKLTDDKRTLARLMTINSVTGGLIQYEQAKTADIGPYLKDIVNSVAGTYNFLVYGQ